MMEPEAIGAIVLGFLFGVPAAALVLGVWIILMRLLWRMFLEAWSW